MTKTGWIKIKTQKHTAYKNLALRLQVPWSQRLEKEASLASSKGELKWKH